MRLALLQAGGIQTFKKQAMSEKNRVLENQYIHENPAVRAGAILDEYETFYHLFTSGEITFLIPRDTTRLWFWVEQCMCMISIDIPTPFTRKPMQARQHTWFPAGTRLIQTAGGPVLRFRS